MACRATAANTVYMPTLAPTSSSTSRGANDAIHAIVSGSFWNSDSTRHAVERFGVAKRMRRPSNSTEAPDGVRSSSWLGIVVRGPRVARDDYMSRVAAPASRRRN